eukprot:gb/GECG01013255.1/.p1 GENE.gb/GECG01013255.1/~~gb/GECG01013255.1/.p1  ORF type:complete len:1327 (+),score=212.76 gb/GECG01013255.1/:1-3981(+)
MEVMSQQQQEGSFAGRKKYGTIASRVEEVRQEVRQEQRRSTRHEQTVTSEASSNRRVSPRQPLNAIETTSRSKPPLSPRKLPPTGNRKGTKEGVSPPNGTNGYYSDRSSSELSNGSSGDSNREANKEVTVPSAASWIENGNGSSRNTQEFHESQHCESTSTQQQHSFSSQAYEAHLQNGKEDGEYGRLHDGSYEEMKATSQHRSSEEGNEKESGDRSSGNYEGPTPYRHLPDERPDSAEAVANNKDNDDSSSYNSETYSVHSPAKLYSGSEANLMDKVGDDSSGSAVKAAIQTLGMMERLMAHNKHDYPEFTSALNKAGTLRGLLASNPNSTQLQKEFTSAVDKAYDLSQQVELSPGKSMKSIRLDPQQLQQRMAEAEEDEPEEHILDLETLRGRLERLLTAAENISMFFDPKYIIIDDTVKQRLSALRAAKETFSKFLQERRQRKPEYAYSQKDVQDHIDAAYACIHDHLIEVSRKWYKHYDAVGMEDGIGPRGLLQMVKTVADHLYNLEKRSKLVITLERCYGKTAEGQLRMMMSSGREKLESQELYTTLSGYIDSTLSLLAELESHSGRGFKFTNSNQTGLFKAAWREFHHCMNGLGSACLAALNLGSANTQTGQKTQIRTFQQALTSLERKYSTALQVFQECLRRKYEEEARRKRAEELVDEESNLRGRLKRQERQVEHILQKARAAKEAEQGSEGSAPNSGSEQPGSGSKSTDSKVNFAVATEIEAMCFDLNVDVNEGWRLGNLVRFQLPEDESDSVRSETYVPLPPDLSTQSREAMDLERLQDFASHIQHLAGRIFDLQQAWQKAVMTAEREAEERKREPPAMERVTYRQSSLPSDPSFWIQQPPQPAESTSKPVEKPKPSLVESQKEKSSKKTGAQRFTLPVAEECKGYRSLAVVLIDQPRLRAFRKYPRGVNALTDYAPSLAQAITLDSFDNTVATVLQVDSNRISARLRALLDIYRNILNFTRVIYKSSKKSVKRRTLVKALSNSTKALKEADANVPGLFHGRTTSYRSVEAIRVFEGYVRRAEMEVISLIMAYEVIIGSRISPSAKGSPRRAQSEGGDLAHSSSSLSGGSGHRFFPEPLRGRNDSAPDEKLISPRSENAFRYSDREPHRPSHGGIRAQNSPRVRADLSPPGAQNGTAVEYRGGYSNNPSSQMASSGNGEAGRSPRHADAGASESKVSSRKAVPEKSERNESPRSFSSTRSREERRNRHHDKDDSDVPDPIKTKKGVQWQRDDGSKWGDRHKGITIDKNGPKQSPRSEGGRSSSKRSSSESPREKRKEKNPMLLKEEAGWHDVESFNKSKGIHHVSSRHNMPLNKKK